MEQPVLYMSRLCDLSVCRHTKKVPRFIRFSEGGGSTVKQRHKTIPNVIANHPALSALCVYVHAGEA